MLLAIRKIYYICNPFPPEWRSVHSNSTSKKAGMASRGKFVQGESGEFILGRASASQAEGREFESRFPLKQTAVAAGYGGLSF